MVIRIPREISFSLENDEKFQIGKWKEIKKGKKSLFIATGSMLKEILSIDEQLKSKGIDGTIVSAASIKPLDEKYILDNLDKYDNIFVVEEAYEKNSFGSSILDFINEMGKKKLINKIAIENGIVPHGKRGELLEEFGLKGENLIKRIEEKIDAGKK